MAAVGVKELRGRMRGKRAFVILTIHLLLVAGFAWMIESLSERAFSSGFSGSFSASSEIGRQLFIAIVFLLTLVTLILAPASTAGAISLEREKQTLDLLTTTPISSLAIVWASCSRRCPGSCCCCWRRSRWSRSCSRSAASGRTSRPGLRGAAGDRVPLRGDRPVRVRARAPHPGRDRHQPRHRDRPDRRHRRSSSCSGRR